MKNVRLAALCALLIATATFLGACGGEAQVEVGPQPTPTRTPSEG